MPQAQTAQQKSQIFKNLVGGLNVREAVTDIADNEAVAASNVVYYTAGAIVRRGGWKKLTANTPTANKLTGVFQATFNLSNVLTSFLVVTDGADVWSCPAPTSLGTTVTWTKRTGSVTLSATNPYKFVMCGNYLIAYNGDVAPVTWAGSGNFAAFPAAGSGQVAVPISRFAIAWQHYLTWFGCTVSGTYYPNRVMFSTVTGTGANAVVDPLHYPSANWLEIPDPDDGDPLMGAAILYGNLIVFKRYSIYVVQGTPPGNLIISRLNTSVGCVSPESITQADNLVYFVSDKGLYAVNLFNVRQVSYKVEPRYTTAVPVSTAAAPIWTAHYKPRGQLFVAQNCQSTYGGAAGTNNDRILCHDYFNADQNGDPAVSEFIVGYTSYGLQAAKPLSTHATAPRVMADYAFAAGSTTAPTVMASFYDSYIYAFSEGSLAGGGPADEVNWLPATTYPADDYLTKFLDFGDPDMIKRMRWLWTTGQNYTGSSLKAGVVYNNNPTATSFVDQTSAATLLASGGGTIYQLSCDDDGALTTLVSSGSGATIVLTDSNGVNWAVGIDNDGALTTAQTSATATIPPVFSSTGGFQYQLTVETNGALSTAALNTPSVATITPGVRVAVLPLVNGVASSTVQGKYIQLYFTDIGILTQFSMDIIFSGRRR